MADKEPTQANGYRDGRPPGREVHPMDDIVIKVIEAQRAELRLYPDVFAWKVTDAILQSRLTTDPQPADQPHGDDHG